MRGMRWDGKCGVVEVEFIIYAVESSQVKSSQGRGGNGWCGIRRCEMRHEMVWCEST